MPNRLIKESIHESEKINRLSDFQFRLWVSLITYVDDYGRGDARPAIIKGTCFPLRERLTNRDIEAALNVLADTGCIGLYEVDGRSYLYFPKWESHQRIRNKVSKYPEPPVDSNLRQSAASCGDMRPESNPNPNPESESESSSGSGDIDRDGADWNPFGAATAAAGPPIDNLVVYASNNLTYMSPNNMDELISFRDSLSDDLIQHAIDEACAAGVRRYTYVRSILNRYVEQGYRTIGDVEAGEARHRKAGQELKQYASEDDFY